MLGKNYKLIVFFIGVTIITTIAVQVFWNIREYQINKQNLVDKVQLSLDNAVEAYFANITKSGIITFTSLDEAQNKKIDTIIVKTKSNRGIKREIYNTLQTIAEKDSVKPILVKSRKNSLYPFVTANKVFPKNIDSLISKVFISISKDSLNLETLNMYLKDELKRNNLDITYGIKYNYFPRHHHKDSTKHKTLLFNADGFSKDYLTATSNTTFLPGKSKLELLFTNETAIVLKDSLMSIFLSLLLSLSVIFSLVYLLTTIYKQKQLSAVKNDLINNITHEFKTPIATISSALEALQRFNAANDKKKSEKYLSMAHSQTVKLNNMVEKMLETAALNTKDLLLTKKPIEIIELLLSCIKKYKLLHKNKTINFNANLPKLKLHLDAFHFENAICNILDNAVNYGGNTIDIKLKSHKNYTEILIENDGNGIAKNQKEKVFEQFYRIPTGNTHNVKGFGIGLYYTKKIIEKHGGSITVIYTKNNKTAFKITLPNA